MPQFDDLNTGTNGFEGDEDAALGNEGSTPEKQEAVAEQQAEVSQMMPSVVGILEACDAEIAAVADIRAYIKELGANADANQIQNEFRARELYIAFIGRLKSGITDRLGEVEQELQKQAAA